MGATAARLALGTAQFGRHYGIANRAGAVAYDEARAIVAAARLAGVDTIDTAVVYGDSEVRLGSIGTTGWRVISKLPPLPADVRDAAEWVVQTCRGSLDRLRSSDLAGLLLHRPTDLAGPAGRDVMAGLQHLKATGLVRRVGFSVYAPEELDCLWPEFPVDMVQAPFNVFDRRLVTSGWLSRLKAEDVEVHVRSTFLQGLLLMRPADRPSRFSRWQGLWDAWSAWLSEHHLTPLQGCLGFALGHAGVDRIVVGVDSLGQFEEIQAAVEGWDDSHPEVPASLSANDTELINPSTWQVPQ